MLPPLNCSAWPKSLPVGILAAGAAGAAGGQTGPEKIEGNALLVWAASSVNVWNCPAWHFIAFLQVEALKVYKEHQRASCHARLRYAGLSWPLNSAEPCRASAFHDLRQGRWPSGQVGCTDDPRFFFTSFQSTISALWLVISARTFLSRVWGLSLSLFPLSNKLITKAQWKR